MSLPDFSGSTRWEIGCGGSSPTHFRPQEFETCPDWAGAAAPAVSCVPLCPPRSRARSGHDILYPMICLSAFRAVLTVGWLSGFAAFAQDAPTTPRPMTDQDMDRLISWSKFHDVKKLILVVNVNSILAPSLTDQQVRTDAELALRSRGLAIVDSKPSDGYLEIKINAVRVTATPVFPFQQRFASSHIRYPIDYWATALTA